MDFSETIVIYDLKIATDDRSDKKFLLIFIWTPFRFISVLESTAYLKFAKLQCFFWLSLPGDYRVTDEALLADTT